jgi:predicted RNase H-like HicB family nuclease
MKATDKFPPYSYLVRWSNKDREFVASFLELPELCGLAPSISAAIQEAKTALHAWLKAAQRESFEIPEPSMEMPCMILDATFAGQEAVLTRDIPEDFADTSSKAETTSAASASVNYNEQPHPQG